MKPILIRNARVVTPPDGPFPRRGKAMGELSVTPCTDVLVHGGEVALIDWGQTLPPEGEILEADGRVLMPGFVDCHTHACYAGDRFDEWVETLRGVSYQDILARGGGIMSTVRSTRELSAEKLYKLLFARAGRMLSHGSTTVEFKSGYGLTAEAELAQLRAISSLGRKWRGTFAATALLGHATDPNGPDVARVVRDVLDAVHAAYPHVAVDAYCEKNAWSVADCVALLERAKSLGHPVRVHADQFNSLGMVREAIRLGALSVDHLEASADADLTALAESETVGVLLPVCALHLQSEGRKFARGRALIDRGGAVAVATNCNPGSSPTVSMPMVIASAVRWCGLSPAEAIVAATVNGAAVLGLHDRGIIAPGARADLILLHHTDERALAHELGGNPVAAVISGGRFVIREPAA